MEVSIIHIILVKLDFGVYEKIFAFITIKSETNTFKNYKINMNFCVDFFLIYSICFETLVQFTLNVQIVLERKMPNYIFNHIITKPILFGLILYK